MDMNRLLQELNEKASLFFRRVGREVRRSVAMAKLQYEKRLYAKRQNLLMQQIGRKLFDDYCRDSTQSDPDLAELLSMCQLLDSLIQEKQDKIQAMQQQ